jgi:hypothetical protein
VLRWAPEPPQVSVRNYNPDSAGAQQTIQDSNSSYGVFVEHSSFNPPIQAVTDTGGNILGLPAGRYVVRVFGQDYPLVSLDTDRIILGKEAVEGNLDLSNIIGSDALIFHGLKFRFDGLTNVGRLTAASISVWDSSGSVMGAYRIPEGQVHLFTVGSKSYPFRIYALEKAGQSDIIRFAIYSRLDSMVVGIPYIAPVSRLKYGVHLEWDGKRQFTAWELRELP